MKPNIRNAITATVFLLTPIVYGAGNESLYMESVGRINPSVNDISVNQDGTYNIFELIDTTLLPQGIAIFNVSSDKNLTEKNLLVDVSL